jgi:predicted nucleic acid-binding Zn ribbon protein
MDVNDENNCYYCGCPIPDDRYFCKDDICSFKFFELFHDKEKARWALALITIFRRRHGYPHIKTGLDLINEAMNEEKP